jgi:hypothetical protein
MRPTSKRLQTAKDYKVSYKLYFNEKLKQISFHGKLTRPLYVQVTFDRKTMFFKSYYFDLFSKPRYALLAGGRKHGPTVEAVIELEGKLIDFVIGKLEDSFSLEKFKAMYSYYGLDLCDAMEDGFRDYLFTFFHDKGMPDFATAISEGSKNKIPYDIVNDLKLALKPALYNEIIENSHYYAPPYLPLFGFMKGFKKWPLLYLSVVEWEDEKLKLKFGEYASRDFRGQDVVQMIDDWLKE